MVFLTAITGDTIGAAYHGLGQHKVDLDREDLIKVAKIFFAYPTLLSFSLLVSKGAVVALLLGLVVKPTYKYILWVSIGILGLLSVLEVIGLFVQCVPIRAIWDPSVERNCHFNVNIVGYLLTGYGTFLDFFLAALPWFFFNGLQIRTKEKLILCISLSPGILAGACGIMRLIKLYELQRSADRVYFYVGLMIWTNTETCISIICVCLSVTRTLYRWHIKGIRINPDSTEVTEICQLSPNGATLQN
ncbi:hypothetical protein T440DRAFT_480693 [Plenodomus tracheiphilus IPT5]|uniref:Rhodopsin domain-containing protein n=1 Tax=Plenodomus tracheiphilus IPT5 TaxID=1408161 RepID=A0A6A7B2I0_9PLEO|nr:hypothetical protein T440DRAFT_480693 [Plenodomus tracheiphilus IPT5]